MVAMIYFQHSAPAVVNSLMVREENGVAAAGYPILSSGQKNGFIQYSLL
jgi:hypothetical protein